MKHVDTVFTSFHIFIMVYNDWDYLAIMGLALL